MLYWLTELSDGGDLFNLFRYITFRAGGAFLTALIFGFIFGRPLIDVLRNELDKNLVVVAPTGVAALNGARGGTDIAEAGRRGIWRHLAHHYEALDLEAPPLR